MKGLKFLHKHQDILWATTRNEIKSRYAGTTFGLLWAVIYPVLFLGMYALVYMMIFKVRLGMLSPADYVLLIFAGLIPFLGFAEALGAGVTSVVGNKSLIKNTLFPIELIPVKSVLASSITMIVGLVLLLVVLWAKGEVHITQLAVPFIFLLQIMFTIGLIWLLSAMNVFFQDLGQITSVVILLLMLISPIAYTQDMIPANMMPIMYPNPLYYLIMLYRDCIVSGTVPINLLLIFSAMSMAIFSLAYALFSRLKKVFPDFL